MPIENLNPSVSDVQLSEAVSYAPHKRLVLYRLMKVQISLDRGIR
jgi:hypothetical protein